MPPLSNSKHEIVAQLVASGKPWETAMVEAGYSPKTARHNMSLLRANLGIQARLKEFFDAQANAKLVTAAKLHARWSEMFEADIADIMNESGAFKPITEWPKVWRQMLSGVDVKELFERSKDGGNASWDKIGEVIKLKFVGVKDLGELLGRHNAVDAFVKQKADMHMHLHVSAQVDQAISEGRQRAAQRYVGSGSTSNSTPQDVDSSDPASS